MNATKKIIYALVLVAVIFVVWLFYPSPLKQNEEKENTKQEKQVSYLCKDSKTIDADYHFGTPIKTNPGEPPKPNGSVNITLSDKRMLSLPQTISASGIRYANTDESIIFWSKGNGSFLLENNKETFMDCIEIAPNPGNLPQTYSDSANGFSIRYPAGYRIDNEYRYQALGPEKEIGGIKFIIPQEMGTGTNLSSNDTGVSIEEISNIQNCDASLFVYPNTKITSIDDNGITYSIASTSDAGAGNFYEETVWAFPGTNPCKAIRYLIHSTNIGNYTPGTTKEFDRKTLIEQFDAIRKSLTLL